MLGTNQIHTDNLGLDTRKDDMICFSSAHLHAANQDLCQSLSFVLVGTG